MGKPLAVMLINRDATVTVCHSKTRNLTDYTKRRYSGCRCGKTEFHQGGDGKNGCNRIDVGVNKVDGKLVGDVDFKAVAKKASFISPVPGGIGPMTVACLMENVIKTFNI